MTIKTILTEPNKILRQISIPVDKVGSEEQKLMDDMLDTMYAAPGIGLAAIQIGVPKRIIAFTLQFIVLVLFWSRDFAFDGREVWAWCATPILLLIPQLYLSNHFPQFLNIFFHLFYGFITRLDTALFFFDSPIT